MDTDFIQTCLEKMLQTGTAVNQIIRHLHVTHFKWRGVNPNVNSVSHSLSPQTHLSHAAAASHLSLSHLLHLYFLSKVRSTVRACEAESTTTTCSSFRSQQIGVWMFLHILNKITLEFVEVDPTGRYGRVKPLSLSLSLSLYCYLLLSLNVAVQWNPWQKSFKDTVRILILKQPEQPIS